ncbi:MAG: carbon-nitrogen hydrolase family protein [Acidobacteriota bacterium]|nr:carbon-nitrogen hydrolase family protein [Acidobacteriota bacterium]
MRRAIAVAQTTPVRGDVLANRTEHIRLLQLAAEEGAQAIVFPELSLTGYELNLGPELAFSMDDERLQPLLAAAAQSSITTIVGAPVRVDSRLHIGAFVLSPTGEIALYTKQRMGAFSAAAACDGIVPPAEAMFFTAGEHDPFIDHGGTPAAIAICADTGLASHPQKAAQRGAKTYCASMFVIPSEFEREAGNLGRYAIEHEMVVAFANYGAATGGLASAGQSAIWSDKGERLVQLAASGSGVAVAIETPAGWRAVRRMRQHAA